MTPNEIVNRRMSCHDEANLSFCERAAYRAELVAEIAQAIHDERERCIAIIRKYLQFDSQRAVSWHEVEDAIEVIRKGNP